ncbi:hypothetical protein Tco_1088168, partial [Tanacetum coccineum]
MLLNHLRLRIAVFTEYLVNISKRRVFWSLSEDILKFNDSDNEYAVSIKEDMAYTCLHSIKTTKETSSIRRIQRSSIRHIEDIVCEDSGRYQTWRHLKTLSLDELRSPDFNSFFDQEYSEEEEAETMAETMKQYMNKTRSDYGSGVTRPKIVDKDNFELKGQFLKELRTNTFSGLDHEDTNEHIEKVLEIVDLFHIPNINIDKVMLRAFPMSLTRATSRWLRNKPTGSITKWDDENLYQAWERFKELLMKCHQHYLMEMQEVILFYNGLGIPSQQILDSRGVIPSKTAADAKAAIQAQLNNLGREIKKVNEKVYASQVGCEQCKRPHYTKDYPLKEDASIRNQGASIKTLEIQIEQMSKVLQERGFGSLPTSTKANPRDQDKSISTTNKADSYPIRHIGSSQYAVSTGQNYTLIKEKDLGSFTLPCFINNVYFDNALVDLGASVSVMPLSTYLNLGLGKLAHTKLTAELADMTVKYLKGIAENILVGIGKFTFPIEFIILDMPEDIKVFLILGRPFLSTAHDKIDVYKRKITLRVREERIIFTSVKPASSLIKRVYMPSLRERMELDLEARIMGETLVLNRSLNPFFEDYIELNDLNKPFELRRNQGDDLIPTGNGYLLKDKNKAKTDKTEHENGKSIK